MAIPAFDPAEIWAPRPAWLRPRTLVLAAQTLIVLAWATELVRLTVSGHPLVGYVAVALSIAGVIVARWFSLAGLVVMATAPWVATVGGWVPITVWTVTVFAVFIRTLRGGSALIVAAGLAVSNFAAAAVFDRTGIIDPNAFIAATSTIAGAAIGSAVRARQRYWRQLQARARDAVATRETEADRRVAQERLRIARDLHDVLGHEIAVISVNLGIAEASLPSTAQDARSAMNAARQGVRSVLRETQQILEVLRLDDGDRSVEPPADFARVNDLLTSFRSLGLSIQADVDQVSGVLPAEVSTAAYRTVQEMLTNAQRHGGGAVTLQIRLTASSLIIRAANSYSGARPAPANTGRGYGLIGMRERVQSAGGQIQVDRDDRAFRIEAILPVPG